MPNISVFCLCIIEQLAYFCSLNEPLWLSLNGQLLPCGQSFLVIVEKNIDNLSIYSKVKMRFQVFRRWHRRVNVAQKRFAIVSAIAASGVPALVQARGHIIDLIPEVPFVITDNIEAFQKTKEAVTFLRRSHVYADVEKVLF